MRTVKDRVNYMCGSPKEVVGEEELKLTEQRYKYTKYKIEINSDELFYLFVLTLKCLKQDDFLLGVNILGVKKLWDSPFFRDQQIWWVKLFGG